MIRLPKLSLVLTLFALLLIAAPASAQIGEHFTSSDGMAIITGTTPNVTFSATGTETATGHGAYSTPPGQDGSFDFDSMTGMVTNGMSIFDFTGGDTLTISFSAHVLTDLSFVGAWTVADGSGAFSGAAGGGTIAGQVAGDLMSFTYMIDGDI